jgi:hypothetical protein
VGSFLGGNFLKEIGNFFLRKKSILKNSKFQTPPKNSQFLKNPQISDPLYDPADKQGQGGGDNNGNQGTKKPGTTDKGAGGGSIRSNSFGVFFASALFLFVSILVHN